MKKVSNLESDILALHRRIDDIYKLITSLSLEVSSITEHYKLKDNKLKENKPIERSFDESPTQSKPTHVTEQLKTRNNKPTLTQEQPTLTQEQPTLTQEQPTLTQEQPTLKQEQPTLKQEQPTLKQEKPTVTQEYSKTKNNKPMQDKTKPILMQEKPKLDKSTLGKLTDVDICDNAYNKIELTTYDEPSIQFDVLDFADSMTI
jgi:cell division protein FtsN